MNKADSYDAPFFGLPNGQNLEPHAKPFYGSTPEKHPTNAKAKVNPQAEVMRAVLEGK